MKISSDHILERKQIAGAFCVPLRLTRLGPDDMADHKCQLKPLLAEMIPSKRYRGMAMENCFERFARTFRWN